MQRKLLKIISVDIDTTGKLLIIFCIHQILEKELEYNEAVHQVFTDLKKAHVSFRRKVLCNILFEFGGPCNW
jgi:hypothetical protein